MDAETLTALQGSIKKWEAIVAGTGVDDGTENCPLCKVFYDKLVEDSNKHCSGCPVSARTGQDRCNGSPYKEWWAGRSLWADLPYRVTEETKPIAQAELDFLKSLLP